MNDEVTAGVYTILKQYAPQFEGELSSDTRLEEIGMESLEIVESIFDLEEHFDITIPNPGESAELNTAFKTVGDVINAVRLLIDEKQAVC